MNNIISIAKKELTELLRDKRVRSAAIFGPMFMILLFLFLLSFIANSVGEPKNTKIHIIKTSNTFVEVLKKQKFEIKELTTEAEARAAVEKGDARLVLQFETDYDAKITSGQPTTVKAYYNPDQEISSVSLSAVQHVFEEINRQVRNTLLTAKGVDPKAVEPLKFESISVKESGKSASAFLVQLLPYFVVLWAFYGGMSSGSELVAGEKEKNTLETLLITPVKRSQIALGKCLSLTAICMLASTSSVVGLLVGPKLPIPGVDKLFKDGPGVTPQAILVLLAVVIPCSALFASLILAVSTNAKNQREAQTHLSLMSFVVLMPSMFSQFIGFTDYANAAWVGAVPILNSANTIRHALQGKFSVLEIGLTLGVNSVIALIAVLVAIRLFEQERVLTRS